MKRWDFKLSDDFQMEFTPRQEEMMSFVTKASQELTEKIMEIEEQLVLSAVSVPTLKRLIELCEQELSRRKRQNDPRQ